MNAQYPSSCMLSDRRGILAGSAALAALPLAATAVASPVIIEPASPAADLLAFAFITRRPELTDAQMRERYEGGHVPGALRAMVPMGLRHYVRNYIQDAIGFAPDYQVISEFGFNPGSVGPDVCGSNIDPNWSRNRSVQMLEYRLSGKAIAPTAQVVRKRAVLLRRPAGTTSEAFAQAARAMGQGTVRNLGSAASRISLYMATGTTREVHECVESAAVAEAVLMIWPESGAKLPNTLEAPLTVAMSAMLDLEAVVSEIQG